MTIKDIAKLSGVGVSTVSRVLNDRPDVSEESRRRVLEVIAEHNYLPNNSARSLVRTKSDTVGLVVRGVQNPFYTDIIRAIEHKLDLAGYTMVMRQIASCDDEVKCGAVMEREKRLQGLIFLGGRSDYSPAELALLNVPFVCCTYTNAYGTLDPSKYSSVSIADEQEAYRAVMELAKKGHRRIAALTADPDDSSISQLRYSGYARALRELGIPPEEEDVMQRLEQALTGCEKLQRHMRFFLDAGSLYKVCNGNLLFHACVPLNADGSLMETEVFGETYKGRALYDVMERYVRAAFDDANPELAKRGRDLLWYMWLGEGSPLFAKSKMATFELYLIAEKEARKEVKNSFYSYLDDERVMGGIFEDFGMDPETSRIVCGHVPVKVKDGEDPVKCGGRVLTIDGGFSKAYQPTTGIAGYTLISNSYGFVLAAHEPLESMRAAVVNELDIHSSRKVVELVDKRTLVADTDNGAVLKQQIADLEELLEAYRNGIVAEKE